MLKLNRKKTVLKNPKNAQRLFPRGLLATLGNSLCGSYLSIRLDHEASAGVKKNE